MRKCLCLFILFTLSSPYCHAAAPGPQDERRIEEQKRQDLLPTESGSQKRGPKEQPPKSPTINPDDILYLAELSFRKVTYGYDLCKTIVILKGVEDEYVNLDAQVAYLREQNYLSGRLKDTFDPMKPLRRGVVASVLSRVLDVKGGVFMNLFPHSQRYALKEMSYEGVMSSGNVHEIISGDELASAITRAVNRMGGQ